MDEWTDEWTDVWMDILYMYGWRYRRECNRCTGEKVTVDKVNGWMTRCTCIDRHMDGCTSEKVIADRI